MDSNNDYHTKIFFNANTSSCLLVCTDMHKEEKLQIALDCNARFVYSVFYPVIFQTHADDMVWWTISGYRYRYYTNSHIHNSNWSDPLA